MGAYGWVADHDFSFFIIFHAIQIGYIGLLSWIFKQHHTVCIQYAIHACAGICFYTVYQNAAENTVLQDGDE